MVAEDDGERIRMIALSRLRPSNKPLPHLGLVPLVAIRCRHHLQCATAPATLKDYNQRVCEDYRDRLVAKIVRQRQARDLRKAARHAAEELIQAEASTL